MITGPCQLYCALEFKFIRIEGGCLTNIANYSRF